MRKFIIGLCVVAFMMTLIAIPANAKSPSAQPLLECQFNPKPPPLGGRIIAVCYEAYCGGPRDYRKPHTKKYRKNNPIHMQFCH